MAAINWEPMYKKYKGLWVGLQDDEETVIASGKTIEEVIRKAKAKGFDRPILTNVPKNLTTYVGLGHI